MAGQVAVSAYMGVVTAISYRFGSGSGVAVSAYMGVVTFLGVLHGVDWVLQSPPTWEL